MLSIVLNLVFSTAVATLVYTMLTLMPVLLASAVFYRFQEARKQQHRPLDQSVVAAAWKAKIGGGGGQAAEQIRQKQIQSVPALAADHSQDETGESYASEGPRPAAPLSPLPSLSTDDPVFPGQRVNDPSGALIPPSNRQFVRTWFGYREELKHDVLWCQTSYMKVEDDMVRLVRPHPASQTTAVHSCHPMPPPSSSSSPFITLLSLSTSPHIRHLTLIPIYTHPHPPTLGGGVL